MDYLTGRTDVQNSTKDNYDNQVEEIDKEIFELMKDPEFTHALKNMAEDPEERKQKFIEFMRYVMWEEKNKGKN